MLFSFAYLISFLKTRYFVGVIAFDGNTGFWLIHSIPNFADLESYKYPDNALVNGQSILCVTFRTAELNEICKYASLLEKFLFSRFCIIKFSSFQFYILNFIYVKVFIIIFLILQYLYLLFSSTVVN